jgi:hypothetical protein
MITDSPPLAEIPDLTLLQNRISVPVRRLKRRLGRWVMV